MNDDAAPPVPPADDKAPDAPADKGPDKAPDAPDLAAQIASLTATVAALTADKARADAAAEEARKASLTEAQRLAEDRQAVEAERKALVQDARKAAAERLGINPKALALAPEVDPRTADGAKALEAWARDNPEFVKAAGAKGELPKWEPESALGKILAGKATHPLIDVANIKKSFGF